jgi:diguanylate cyclase (GGDEF)-like protein/PAS domain S-box-containing protein
VICLLDGDLTVCYVTPAVERVLGISPLELLGQSWLDVVDEADRGNAHDLVLRAASGRPAQAELRLRTSDGRERIVDTTVTDVDDDSHAGFVLTCHDVTDRRALEQDLAHQSFHDALTGLPNRALFRDRVTHALRRSRRSRGSCAVLFLDLDDFKTINDGLGHAVGDSVLREVSARLVGVLREGDTAARLGGDEFAVLLEDCDAATCSALADRLITALGAPYAVGDTEIVPYGSVGIAVAAGDDTTTDDLMRNADLALYEAKNGGKSRWRLFARACTTSRSSAWRSRTSCGARSPSARSSSTTSRSWRSRQATSSASRRSPGGSTRPAGFCCPAGSSPSPRTPG